jgi:hypothetical protein
MSPLLDRFRTQPRYKHPDPVVRLAFVHEIPIDEHDLLSEIARGDEDVRVRRAAAAKLMNPRALAEIAGADADEGVRSQANTMLRDIALEAFESVGEADSLAAVDAIADPRLLATVAKTAPREITAARAAMRLTDPHALGAVARQAPHESVRRGAFERLEDRQEILALALNSEFKDPALDAVERFADRATLNEIATRARNRMVSKHARQIVREIDDRSAREAAAQAAAAEAAQARLDRDAEERATRETALRLERQDAARRQAELDAERDAERARRDAETEAARRRGRLTELVAAAEAAAGEADLGAARRGLAMARHEWRDAIGASDVDPGLAARFAAADAQVTARGVAAQETEQRVRREALERLLQLAARLEPLVARADLALKPAERALRDLRAALASIPPLPSRHDYEGIVHRLKAAQAALIPKVQELRDVADWQRWANVGIQEQLCEKMEALKSLPDPEAIARHVRDLQQQWRLSADVPRAQGEALWRRFKTAHDEAWAKCEAHFAAQAAARDANLAQKLALAERAEALAGSTHWIQTADEIKKLQAAWKTIGPVTRGQERVVWDRFRAACDRFFTRRQADLAERKTVWAQNLAVKDALCVRAEALAESTDWDAAAVEIRRLQSEWKAIGPVKKTRAEAIWQRFRAACDLFFTRHAHRHEIAREERVAAREAIVAELEGLVPLDQAPGTAAPPAELAERVRALRGRWQQELALRGVDRERAAGLDHQYGAALAGVIAAWPSVFNGTDLDPDANRRRMESLVSKMEDLATSLAGPAAALGGDDVSPTTRLAAMLKEALASNTIGGKVDEGSRLRAAVEDMRQAQAAWSRIGPVPDPIRRGLADRFQKAIRRISERAGGVSGSGRSGVPLGPRVIRS